MIDLTPIVEAVITLLMALITAFLIPWLKQRIGADKIGEVQKWVKIAVEAAEMIYVGAGRGAEKKQYVIDYLANKGYKLDTESIDVLIESAVLKIQNGGDDK